MTEVRATSRLQRISRQRLQRMHPPSSGRNVESVHTVATSPNNICNRLRLWGAVPVRARNCKLEHYLVIARGKAHGQYRRTATGKIRPKKKSTSRLRGTFTANHPQRLWESSRPVDHSNPERALSEPGVSKPDHRANAHVWTKGGRVRCEGIQWQAPAELKKKLPRRTLPQWRGSRSRDCKPLAAQSGTKPPVNAEECLRTRTACESSATASSE